MPRHQVTVEGSTLADIEAAVTALRGADTPEDAVIRFKTKPSLNPDGGRATTMSARWTHSDG